MIEFTQKEYEKIRKKGIKTNEGHIFTNPKDKKKIIKVIESKVNCQEYLEIKKQTIKLLLENKEYLCGLKIAIPEEGVSIDKTERGYTSNKIKGDLLYFVLNDPTISLDIKISCLKQVGEIIRSLETIRNNNPNLRNLFYNDIHEYNFMVTNSFEVIGLDFDSCSIGNNTPIQGLYPMMLNSVQPENNKYQKCAQICEYSTQYIPDMNLELFSYTMIILNLMCGIPMYRWTPRNLDKYLNFLETKGANLELLYALSYVFDKNEKNVNPDYLLDYIEDIYPHSCVKFDETGILRRTIR